MLYPKLDVLKSKVNSKYILDNYVSHKEVGKALEEIAEGKVSVLEK